MRLHYSAFGLVLVASSLPSLAAQTPADDMDVYRQKLDDCTTRLASDHPEMSTKQRRKACKAQVGPSPKGVVPAKAPAPVF